MSNDMTMTASLMPNSNSNSNSTSASASESRASSISGPDLTVDNVIEEDGASISSAANSQNSTLLDSALIVEEQSVTPATEDDNRHSIQEEEQDQEREREQETNDPAATTETSLIDDIASAAEAAANAVEEADAEEQRMMDQQSSSVTTSCRICGQGAVDGRPLLQFLPTSVVPTPLSPSSSSASASASTAITQTFGEHICLHIFCGKTASILPSVNKPELEILTKAGIKNKHGIGPEVNAALVRTRQSSLLMVHTGISTPTPLQSSTATATATAADTKTARNILLSPSSTSTSSSTTPSSGLTPDRPEKQYFLVREFEANLQDVKASAMIHGDDSINAFIPTASSKDIFNKGTVRKLVDITSSSKSFNDNSHKKFVPVQRTSKRRKSTNSSQNQCLSASSNENTSQAQVSMTNQMPQSVPIMNPLQMQAAALAANYPYFASLFMQQNITSNNNKTNTNASLHPQILQNMQMATHGIQNNTGQFSQIQPSPLLLGGFPQILQNIGFSSMVPTMNPSTKTTATAGSPAIYSSPQMPYTGQSPLMPVSYPQPQMSKPLPQPNSLSATQGQYTVNQQGLQMPKNPRPPIKGAVPLPPPLPTTQELLRRDQGRRKERMTARKTVDTETMSSTNRNTMKQSTSPPESILSSRNNLQANRNEEKGEGGIGQ